MDELYDDLLSTKKFEAVNFSDLLNIYKNSEKVNPIPSSWSSREEDIKKKVYYPLWKNPKNEIHTLQWRLTDLAIKTVNENAADPGFSKARRKLDRALHSDQYWWTSANPWWSVEIIENGAKMLTESIEILKNISPKEKNQAENLYQKISATARIWQNTGRAQKIKEAYLAGEPYERYFAGKIVK
jgi:hypothetical protein